MLTHFLQLSYLNYKHNEIPIQVSLFDLLTIFDGAKIIEIWPFTIFSHGTIFEISSLVDNLPIYVYKSQLQKY